jgi:hypothetical protein
MTFKLHLIVFKLSRQYIRPRLYDFQQFSYFLVATTTISKKKKWNPFPLIVTYSYWAALHSFFYDLFCHWTICKMWINQPMHYRCLLRYQFEFSLRNVWKKNCWYLNFSVSMKWRVYLYFAKHPYSWLISICTFNTTAREIFLFVNIIF